MLILEKKNHERDQHLNFIQQCEKSKSQNPTLLNKRILSLREDLTKARDKLQKLVDIYCDKIFGDMLRYHLEDFGFTFLQCK